MVVAGSAQLHVRGHKVRDNQWSSPVLKAKHVLFSGTVFRCDVLVAAKLFGPGFNDDRFNVTARLRHVMKERPLEGTITTPSSFELMHCSQEAFCLGWLD